ncbi:IS701 family transposase [Tundrisphaera lichenicola]|uniref:IS701 family transposase n=1 Tax=Tundrisphaera lichenicola TaxID=2029860 RepID=UPI003EC0905D
MNRTYTPELAPEVLERLDAYAARFRDDFNRPRQAQYSGVYLQGLILDGDRKSIEPLSRKVTLPTGLVVADLDQALQQFIGQSTWDEMAVWKRHRSVMAESFASPAGIFVIDDTSFPKQGKLSVGVQRQYCGAQGKKANCQVAPSVHYVAPKGHYPLAMRLYLPEAWLDDSKRLDKAGVPREQRRALTKGQIALELLDLVRAEGLPGRLVVADAGYGVSGLFREGLAERGLSYSVGVTDEMVVFTEEPSWEVPGPAIRPPGSGGRPRRRSRLKAGTPKPVSLRELAASTPLRKVTWREGTKGKLSGRFAWLRVWPGGGWATGECAGAEPVWLLIEEQADGKIKYALSNLPGRTSRIKAVRLWKSRWPVEQGYQQMKEELGLDHHEGRSWRGFHHHACLVMLAFGFLALEREREERDPARPGKRGGPAR